MFSTAADNCSVYVSAIAAHWAVAACAIPGLGKVFQVLFNLTFRADAFSRHPHRHRHRLGQVRPSDLQWVAINRNLMWT